MKKAIDETERRRTIQKKYNEEHHITPHSVVKSVRDVIEIAENEDKGRRKHKTDRDKKLTENERGKLIEELTAKMRQAAKELRFEEAAAYRDRIRSLTK